MYTLSIMKGCKPKYILCDTFEKASGLARLYWYLSPMIIDNQTHQIVAFDMNISLPESEM